MVDLLADYLARAEAGDLPVLPGGTPEQLVARWPARFRKSRRGTCWACSQRVVAAVEPPAPPALRGPPGDRAAAAAPRCASWSRRCSTTAWRSTRWARSATAMERSVLALDGRAARPPRDGAGGVLTSGGSAGNLTALLAARQAQAGFDAWTGGARGGPAARACWSRRAAHYSIARAVQIMGWGAGGVIPVAGRRAASACAATRCRGALAAADARRPQGHRRRGQRRLHRDRRVRSARRRSPTSAQRHGLWLHVDGAHGASRRCCRPRTAHQLRGHRARRLGGVGRAQDAADAGAGHRGAVPRRGALLRGVRPGGLATCSHGAATRRAGATSACARSSAPSG